MVGDARPPASKAWCFTLNNPEISELELYTLLESMGIEYAIFQLEAGEAGTPHFQGYLILTSKQRLTYLKTYLPTAHFEKAKGSPSQNRTYCSKAEGRIGDFAEIGVFPEKTQGKRNDLNELHSALKAGLTQADYSNEYFNVFLHHPNLVTNYRLAQIPPRDSSEQHECIFIYGPAGTGKSRLANHIGGDGYRHDLGKWFDGYLGQRTLILDDFGGASLPFRTFKRIVDRYPVRVEVKGTSCELATTKTIITSNFLPEAWWSKEVIGNSEAAIFRRITSVIWAPVENLFYQFPDYSTFARLVLTPHFQDGRQETIPQDLGIYQIQAPWLQNEVQ